MILLLPTLLAGAAHAGSTQIVVDDEDGAPTFTTTTENWATWDMGSYGHDGSDTSYHYLSHTVGDGTRTGTATWSPSLPSAGTWRIETWFRRTENRTSDADHVITDGSGATHRVTLDQRGDGGSGWVLLGEYACAAGAGGCSVTLDGDDGQSDEANAMRFTLIGAGEPGEVDPCEETTGPGAHERTWYAGAVDAQDWTDTEAALGAPDGAEATTANVDEGEYLAATSWAACDPAGEEGLDRVSVGVLARTQYDSGTYALELRLDAGGAADLVFTGTEAGWHVVDVTGDRAAWTWADVAALRARVTLADHPGGRRDSDAWVDAFAVSVAWTGAEPADTGVPDTGVPDTGVPDTGGADSGRPDDSGDPGADPSDSGASDSGDDPGKWTDLTAVDGCGCASGRGAVGAWVVAVLAVVGRRRSPATGAARSSACSPDRSR